MKTFKVCPQCGQNNRQKNRTCPSCGMVLLIQVEGIKSSTVRRVRRKSIGSFIETLSRILSGC